jgi:hypothetical protein
LGLKRILLTLAVLVHQLETAKPELSAQVPDVSRG